MIYTQSKICSGEWDTQTPFEFWNTNGIPNPSQTTRLVIIDNKKGSLPNYGLCCLGWPQSKIERKRPCSVIEKTNKLWNMKVLIIPIVIGALVTVTKGLVQGQEDLEIRGRVETVQTTALLRSTRILRKVLKTWGDLLSLKL